jgi:hypothetical protein
MSVYGSVVVEMTDLDRLAEAIGLAGLGHMVERYPNGDGIYRKYSGLARCEGGSIRGSDAVLVIHGGLDTSGLYKRGTTVGGSGDTAFVLVDGKLEARIDINWHNAPQNWELIKNWYAAIGVMRRAKRMGIELELSVDKATGKIAGRAKPTRGVTTSGIRAQAQRPVATR